MGVSVEIVRPKDLTIIIPCHNYARYLNECLLSIINQTQLPLKVHVYDDASTDNPLVHCIKHGAKYTRVNFRNVHTVRRVALESVTTKYVLFLDADNKLPPSFIESAINQLESDRKIAGVFPILNGFGAADGPRHNTNLAPNIIRSDDIQLFNRVDAGTVWRTDALRQSQALEDDVSALSNCGDWRVARRVLASGPWHLVKGNVPLLYRVHDKQMSLRKSSYWVDADLNNERVTLILALSGRWHHWPSRLQWLLSQPWPNLDLLIINSSHQRVTPLSLGLADYDKPLNLIHSTLGYRGLADEDRRKSLLSREKVETVVSSIYNRAIKHAQNEYLLFLEDDVFPKKPNFVAKLLSRFDPSVAAVSGAYPHRYSPESYCAFNLPWTGQLIPKIGPKIQKVSGTGFGCFMVRKSVLDKYPLSGDDIRIPHYDIDFAVYCHKQRMKILLDRSVECEHRFEAVNERRTGDKARSNGYDY